MFRRKRFGGSASAIPWWPTEAPTEPPGGSRGFGSRGFGSGGFDDLGPPGDRPRGVRPAPPLATHDPFGGWPAFAEHAPPPDPLLGQPHPSTGWPLVDSFGGPADPAAPPDPVHPPDPAGPGGAGPHGGTSDWLPLLTHQLGDQRFRPDVEAPAVPSAPPAPTSGAANRAGGAAASPLTSATTWLDPIVAPDPAEASSLAGAFAADYLSWDQDNPARRGQVLKQYLPSDVTGDPTLLGWSGKGRQRSEFALPGAVYPDGECRLVVDVRVRVTPYRRVGENGKTPTPTPTGELEVAGVPAVAPAPTARGWKSLDSHWVRLTVPVTREGDRLVVDTWDEQLGQEPSATRPRGPDTADPTTAEDTDDTDQPAEENP